MYHVAEVEMKIKPIFAWYDFWIGLFWDRKKKTLYIFPVPTVGLKCKMKKPKNTSNFSECVRYKEQELYIYCVECDNWKRVFVRCTSTVEYKQTMARGKVLDCLDLIFLCEKCHIDIGYLLSDYQKYTLVKRIDIPIKGKYNV